MLTSATRPRTKMIPQGLHAGDRWLAGCTSSAHTVVSVFWADCFSSACESTSISIITVCSSDVSAILPQVTHAHAHNHPLNTLKHRNLTKTQTLLHSYKQPARAGRELHNELHFDRARHFVTIMHGLIRVLTLGFVRIALLCWL